MKKTDLLTELQKGLRTEESSIKIYAHHVAEIASRSGLNDEQILAITRVTSHLRAESIRHKGIISELIKQLKEDPRDDI
jgi:rubrerythrin